MHSETSAVLTTLEGLWAEIRQILQGVEADGLAYVPGTASNSLAVIARHVAGSQEWWIGETLGGQDVHRDRDAEFIAADLDLDGILGQLDESCNVVREVLQAVTADMLEETRTYQQQQVTVHWILCRVLSHVSLHVGHMHITRQLWDMQRDAGCS